jgi:hypothetical protein
VFRCESDQRSGKSDQSLLSQGKDCNLSQVRSSGQVLFILTLPFHLVLAVLPHVLNCHVLQKSYNHLSF